MDKDGNKTGGREKGKLNKRSEIAIELIEQSKLGPLDYDLAILNWDLEKLGITEAQAADIDTRTQLELRQKASDSLKPHAYPKLKAMEISIDEESKKGLALAYPNPKQP